VGERWQGSCKAVGGSRTRRRCPGRLALPRAAPACTLQGSYGPQWRAHVLAHLPFYMLLLPHFVELCYNRFSFSKADNPVKDLYRALRLRGLVASCSPRCHSGLVSTHTPPPSHAGLTTIPPPPHPTRVRTRRELEASEQLVSELKRVERAYNQ